MSKEETKEVLFAAGQLAIAARNVIHCKALDISFKIEELEKVLNEYDKLIISKLN